MEAAAGRVLAAFTTCPQRCESAQPRYAIYRTAVGGNDWRRVPGAAALGYGTLALTASKGYALGEATQVNRGTLVTGPVTGPGRWRQLTMPCTGRWLPADVAVARAGPVLACNSPPGAHPVPVRLYASADGGLRWHQLISLSFEDGVGTLSIAPDGLIIAGGMYSGMVISRDGGRTWHEVRSVDRTHSVGGGGGFAAAMVTNQAGFAYVVPLQVWLTRDGGRIWTEVTIR